MDLPWPVQSYTFQAGFYPLFLMDRFIMGYHGVDFLNFDVKLYRHNTLGFAYWAWLLVFVCPLRIVLVRLIPQYFTLLWGVSGSMKQAFFSPVVQLLIWPACFFLILTARPFLRFVGEADSPPFFPWLERLASALMVVFEVVPPL